MKLLPVSPAARKSARRWLQLAGSILSGGLFLLLLVRQDWQQVLESLQQMPLWTLPLVLVLFFSGLMLNALRWYILLHSQKLPISFFYTLKIVVAGQFASNFLPSTVGGDALRLVSVLPLAERAPEGRLLAVGSVVLDRALNVCAMLTYLPVAWWVFADFDMALGAASARPGGALSAGGAGWGGKKLKDFAATKIVAPLQSALRFWYRRPFVLAAAFVVAWFSILVVFVGVWVLARNLGLPVTLAEVTAVSALVYLVTLLPISVNGYGVREVAVTALYVQLGATVEQAATLALVTRLLTLVETLPGACWVSPVLSTAALGEAKSPDAAASGPVEETP